MWSMRVFSCLRLVLVRGFVFYLAKKTDPRNNTKRRHKITRTWPISAYFRPGSEPSMPGKERQRRLSAQIRVFTPHIMRCTPYYYSLRTQERAQLGIDELENLQRPLTTQH